MQMIHMPSNGLFSVTAQQTDEGSWTVMGEDDNGVRWIINDDFVLSYLVRGGTKLRSIRHKGYESVQLMAETLHCSCRIGTENGSNIEIVDIYTIEETAVAIERTMCVCDVSADDDGFFVDITIRLPGMGAPEDCAWFAPGRWYGKGRPFFQLDEKNEDGAALDSFTAPVMMCLDEKNGRGIVLIDNSPGRRKTIAEDCLENVPGILNSDSFYLPGMGVRKLSESSMGLFVTYPAYTHVDGQGTLYRLLPVHEDIERKVSLKIQKADYPGYQQAMRDVWRGIYDQLAQPRYFYDPDDVRQALLKYIDDSFTDEGGIAKYMKDAEHNEASSGFLFRNIDLAHLLLEAWREQRVDGWKEHAIAVVESQIEQKRMYAADKSADPRPAIESLHSLVKCWECACAAELDMPHWLGTALAETEEFLPLKEYFSIPLMVTLYRITGEGRYLGSALEKAEWSWDNYFSHRYFTGGITDCDPGSMDRESASLALEGYLDLFEALNDDKWLERAAFYADYLETMQVIQDVDMEPAGATGKEMLRRMHHNVIQAAPGNNLSALGLSFIGVPGASGDIYNVYSAPDFYRLYQYTKDMHYLHFACLLQYYTMQYVNMDNKVNGMTDLLRGTGRGYINEFFAIGVCKGYVQGRGWAHADNIGWCPYVILSSMYRMKQLTGQYKLPYNGNDLE